METTSRSISATLRNRRQRAEDDAKRDRERRAARNTSTLPPSPPVIEKEETMTNSEMLKKLGMPTFAEVTANNGAMHKEALRRTRKAIVQGNDTETLSACLGNDIAALKRNVNYNGETV